MTDSSGSRDSTIRTGASGVWLVYTAMALGGLLLLAEAFEFSQLQKWTAKVGIALLFTAISLVIGNGKKTGYLAVVIIWSVVVGFFFYGFVSS